MVAALASSQGALASLSAAGTGCAHAAARVGAGRATSRRCEGGGGSGVALSGGSAGLRATHRTALYPCAAGSVRRDCACDGHTLWVACVTIDLSSVANSLRPTAPMAQEWYLGTHMVRARPVPSNKRTTTVVLCNVCRFSCRHSTGISEYRYLHGGAHHAHDRELPSFWYNWIGQILFRTV